MRRLRYPERRFAFSFVRRYRWRFASLDIDWSMRNRLRFMLDDERRWIAVCWGNGYSDPVWSLQIGPWRPRG